MSRPPDDMLDDAVCRQVARWLAASTRAVAFSGAGISTESGIPDFRSPGGVWANAQPVYYDEFLASTAARREYWRQKAQTHRAFAEALPNAGHQTLAQWQAAGRLRAVITQNIDGLHQLAGSTRVLELHGTARQVGCLSCSTRFDAGPFVEQYLETDEPPSCPQCGGHLKHATVSFGQTLPQEVLEEAVRLSQQADLLIAIGSSLVVYPAASLPLVARQHGARVVIINREPTEQDAGAAAVLRGSIGAALARIDAHIAQSVIE